MPKHITLVGMMGSGKSTVAPLVATALRREVIEVDALIEAHEGMPISEIFIAKGEAYFRRVESAVIAQVLANKAGVISPGGGAFQQEETRALMLQHSVVFYLSASEEVLVSRLQTELAVRPLLNQPGIDPRDTVRDLLARRSAAYALAHYRVDTDAHAPEGVARAVLALREAYE